MISRILYAQGSTYTERGRLIVCRSNFGKEFRSAGGQSLLLTLLSFCLSGEHTRPACWFRGTDCDIIEQRPRKYGGADAVRKTIFCFIRWAILIKRRS